MKLPVDCQLEKSGGLESKSTAGLEECLHALGSAASAVVSCGHPDCYRVIVGSVGRPLVEIIAGKRSPVAPGDRSPGATCHIGPLERAAAVAIMRQAGLVLT